VSAPHPRTWLALALALALAAAPEVASACSSCVSGAGDDRTQVAYRVGALLFTALPLAFLSGFVWWIVRRSRALAALDARPLAPAQRGAAFRTSSSR
jgi:hypothetical protein